MYKCARRSPIQDTIRKNISNHNMLNFEDFHIIL